MKTLPLPKIYDPKNAARHAYSPASQAVFDAAGAAHAQHAIKPAASDRKNVHLLLIDVQKDFCFPEGTLYVAGRSGTGAVDDNKRLAEFVYRNLPALTNITTTMD